MLRRRLELMRSLTCSSEENICVFLKTWPRLFDILSQVQICVSTHEHSRTRFCTIHQRTLTTSLILNTTSRCNSVHIWISFASLARVSGCALLIPCWERNGLWQLSVVGGFGDCGERCVVGQIGGCHRQGPWVAKLQSSSTCCGAHARRSSSSSRRWYEIREFIEEEHGWISVKMCPIASLCHEPIHERVSVCCASSTGVRTVLHLQDCHIRDRRKFAEESKVGA